jgi:hypothetical protein
MPPQQRCRRDEEDLPAFAWQQPRQRSQHHPIDRCITRPGDLPPDHHQLMPQHGDLHVLGIRRRTQADRTKDAADVGLELLRVVLFSAQDQGATPPHAS